MIFSLSVVLDILSDIFSRKSNLRITYIVYLIYFYFTFLSLPIFYSKATGMMLSIYSSIYKRFFMNQSYFIVYLKSEKYSIHSHFANYIWIFQVCQFSILRPVYANDGIRYILINKKSYNGKKWTFSYFTQVVIWFI